MKNVLSILLCIVICMAMLPVQAFGVISVAAPANVTVKVTDSSHVIVNWNKVLKSSGYKVYRADSKYSTYKCIKTVKSKTTVRYMDKTVKQGRSYFYKVKSYRIVNGKKKYSKYSKAKGIYIRDESQTEEISGEEQSSDKNGFALVNEETEKYREEVLDIVNEQRAREGAAPVVLDAKLCDVAQIKAEEMAKLSYFSHESPTYGSPFEMMKTFGITYRTAGENIAMGQRTAAEVMIAWMNSEGHRKNILKADYTGIGIGVYADEKTGYKYWVQQFIG